MTVPGDPLPGKDSVINNRRERPELRGSQTWGPECKSDQSSRAGFTNQHTQSFGWLAQLSGSAWICKPLWWLKLTDLILSLAGRGVNWLPQCSFVFTFLHTKHKPAGMHTLTSNSLLFHLSRREPGDLSKGWNERHTQRLAPGEETESLRMCPVGLNGGWMKPFPECLYNSVIHKHTLHKVASLRPTTVHSIFIWQMETHSRKYQTTCPRPHSLWGTEPGSNRVYVSETHTLNTPLMPSWNGLLFPLFSHWLPPG